MLEAISRPHPPPAKTTPGNDPALVLPPFYFHGVELIGCIPALAHVAASMRPGPVSFNYNILILHNI